jgi:serine/threonine protein kinase
MEANTQVMQQTSKVLEIKAINQADQERPFYLHLEGPERVPIVLGTGRNAVVFLATTTADEGNAATDYHAIKFLRDDVDHQYALAAAYRFFEEAAKAQGFDRLQAAFVNYYGWGAIGRPSGELTDTGQQRDFWWTVQFKHCADRIRSDDPEFERLRQHFKLQGPFYVLKLCQGTLHDLLDNNLEWAALPPYVVEKYRNSLMSQAKKSAADINDVSNRFLARHPSGKSGYDILNSFNTDKTANSVRSFAVLELFAAICRTVAQLHTKNKVGGPLAHRDLKPGNLFFEHSADPDGMENIKVRLADLGYVTTNSQIEGGEKTLIAGQKGIDYMAPGSQFYRAPEQAELPVEVRVDVDPKNPYQVHIRGSKISAIEMHDWLQLGDLFGTEVQPSGDSNPNLFKIMKVEYQKSIDSYDLTLDKPIVSSRHTDLQAQITRATGFHTDGYSLGAILYDLVSGGKNPELFYTYCLMSFTGRFGVQFDTSVDDVLEILAPQHTSENGKFESDRLSFGERSRMMPLVFSSHDLDTLLSSILDTALAVRHKDNLGEQKAKLTEQLRNYRFRSFDMVNDLLRDRRNVPIPRDILDIIVRCMLRGVPGSFYQRDTEKAYLSDQSFEAANAIYESVMRLLGNSDYQLPRDGFPASLQQNLLFKLRSLALPGETATSA